MKLLTPKAAQDMKSAEVVRDVFRVQETDKATEAANKRLAQAEADFAFALARSREIWTREEDEYAKKIADFEIEVIALEERKKQALIPLEIYQKQADDILAEAKGILEAVKAREQHSENVQEALEERLEEVGGREQDVSAREVRIDGRLKGVELQESLTKQDGARLAAHMHDFYAEQERQEASLKERKTEVTLAEISVNSKLAKNKRDVDAIALEWRKIDDARATLERAFKRIGMSSPLEKKG